MNRSLNQYCGLLAHHTAGLSLEWLTRCRAAVGHDIEHETAKRAVLTDIDSDIAYLENLKARIEKGPLDTLLDEIKKR